MCFLGMAFWFPILFFLGRVRWETAPNKLWDEENQTCFPRDRRVRETQKILRVYLAAALGSVVA